MTALDPERWRRMQPLLDDALTLPPDGAARLARSGLRRRPRATRDVRSRAARGRAGRGFLDTPLSPFPKIVLAISQVDVSANSVGPSAFPSFSGWAQAAWVSFMPCMTGFAVMSSR